MKKFIYLFLISLTFNSFSQSKSVLAKSYYAKAEKEFEAKNFTTSIEMLDQAKVYLEGSTYPKIEYLYIMNHYKLGNYAKSDQYVKRFFDLNPSEDSSMYTEIIDIIADIKVKAKEKEEKVSREKERLRILKIEEDKENALEAKKKKYIRLFNNSKSYYGNGAVIYEFEVDSDGKLKWYYKTDAVFNGKKYYNVRYRGHLYFKNVTRVKIEGSRIIFNLNYSGFRQQAKVQGYDWASYVTNKNPYGFTINNESKRNEIFEAIKFLVAQY